MATEGWNWIFNARKWHYFRDGRSLCGRWMTLTMPNDLETGNLNSPDNCKACVRKRKKEIERKTNMKGIIC